MKTDKLLLLALSCCCSTLGAADYAVPLAAQLDSPAAGLPPGLDPIKAGQELAATVRSMAPEEDARVTGRLKMRKGEGNSPMVPLVLSTTVRDSSWQVTYESGGSPQIGPERLTLRHELNRPTTYLYAHGKDLSAPVRLNDDQLMVPFAGSDFALFDLGMGFFHWPNQRLVKFEMRRGRSSRVLESAKPKPKPGEYSRVLSWIDVETDGLLQAEAYDAQGKLLKEFRVGSIRKVAGRWQVQDLEIRNLQAKTRTTLEFDLQNKTE